MASSQSTAIQRLTESGLARDLGVSRQAVHDLVKRGILNKDKDGKIDVEMAKIALANRVRPSAKTAAALDPANHQPASSDDAAPSPDAGATSYHVAKTLREAAEAQIARLRLAEMRGELIHVSAVESVWSAALVGMREHLLQIRARLAPLLANESDAFKVEQMLELEHNQALHLLAGATMAVATTSAAAPIPTPS